MRHRTHASDPAAGVSALLAAYAASHSATTTTSSYVVGTYGCPVQLGNRMHEFLNAVALAVVTNRTLVWKYTDQPGYPTGVGDCERLVHRRPWIQPEEVAARRVAPRAAARLAVMAPRASRSSLRQQQSGAAWLPLNLGLHLLDAPRRLVCDVQSSRFAAARAVSLGCLEWQQAAALAAPGTLPPAAAARAATLFALGADHAYGALWHVAFEYDRSSVREHTRRR